MPSNQTLTGPATETASAWAIDPSHSSAEFAVKHLMISTVTGRFKGLQGDLHLDPAKPEAARVEATIDVATVHTGDEKRDAHLRSADFFHAEQHPAMTFRSKRVAANGPERAVVVGDLTIRGTTLEVPLTVTFEGRAKDPWGNERVAFTGETVLDRKAFGLGWNQVLEAGGVLVGDQVRVTLRIQAVRRPAP